MIHYWVVLSPFSPRVIAATLSWAHANRCISHVVVFPSCSHPSSHVTRRFPYLHVCLSFSSSMSLLQLLLLYLSPSFHECLSTQGQADGVSSDPDASSARNFPLRSSPCLQRRLNPSPCLSPSPCLQRRLCPSMFTSSLIRSDVCYVLLSRLHSLLHVW